MWRGVGENFVADQSEKRQLLAEQFWITAVAALDNPLRPLIAAALMDRHGPEPWSQLKCLSMDYPLNMCPPAPLSAPIATW